MSGIAEWTIREAWMKASSFLEQEGVEEGAASAERLLCHLMGWDRTALFLHWSEPFPTQKFAAWQAMLERRAGGEPVQYITGIQDFYGAEFHVNPSVLIPRPETELLVEAIIEASRKLWPMTGLHVVDIGTGSGAIAITLARCCPDWRITATDISSDALETASSNAKRHNVAERIRFVRADLMQPLLDAEITGIDMVVSNPPYIETAVIDSLQREVREHEPRTALDGGADGLTFYRRLVEQMKRLPRLPRLVGFETGAGQAEQVADLLAACAHWEEIRIIRDLAGIGRHVLAIRIT